MWQCSKTRRSLLVGMLYASVSLGTMPSRVTSAQQVNEIDKERYIGNPYAKLIVEEYFSATCPHCRSFHVDVFPILKKEYIDTGRVGWQFRDFPLDQESLLVAKIARCAPEGYYAQIVDVFLQYQNRWRGKGLAQIQAVALESGFSRNDIDRCLKDKTIEDSILQEISHAQKIYGVSGTPSFVIDGELQKGDASLINMRLILSRVLRALRA